MNMVFHLCPEHMHGLLAKCKPPEEAQDGHGGFESHSELNVKPFNLEMKEVPQSLTLLTDADVSEKGQNWQG